MSKILKLALLLLVAYLVFANYESWVDSISELGQGLSRTNEPVSEGGCVAAAETASEAFAVGMRNYASPPVDMDAWDEFLEGVKERVYEADTSCNCARDSCVKAMEALTELNLLIEDFDGSLRGTSMPLNPARRQETIDRMLKRARELDRQGS